MACLLKARIVKLPERAVPRERLNNRHKLAATNTHATIVELLETMFSVRSVPSLYKEDQLPFERESAGGQLRVAVVRSNKLVAEAGNSSGTQRKKNVRP
jgi:hypothetical protein